MSMNWAAGRRDGWARPPRPSGRRRTNAGPVPAGAERGGAAGGGGGGGAPARTGTTTGSLAHRCAGSRGCRSRRSRGWGRRCCWSDGTSGSPARGRSPSRTSRRWDGRPRTAPRRVRFDPTDAKKSMSTAVDGCLATFVDPDLVRVVALGLAEGGAGIVGWGRASFRRGQRSGRSAIFHITALRPHGSTAPFRR